MWPKDLIDLFDAALRDVTLAPGYTKEKAIRKFLDDAACMAVWRCEGKPEGLEGAYFFPYTPIGHLTASGMGGTMTRVGLGGSSWREALNGLKEFIRENRDAIIEKYRDTPQPYPC